MFDSDLGLFDAKNIGAVLTENAESLFVAIVLIVSLLSLHYNAQYNRRETLEINPVPLDIADNALEQSVCQALSLTEIAVEPDDLQACHRMRKKDRVIIKFKCRKQKHRVLSNRKTLQNKSLNFTQLKFSGTLFVNESMCHENHQLTYKCRQLKSARKIHATWFYNSTLHIKRLENGPIHKIFQPTDIEKFWGLIIWMNI